MQNTEEVILERIKFGFSQLITEELLADMGQVKLTSYKDFITNSIVINAKMLLLGKTTKEVSVSYPATWWDAVKKRFAPKWFTDKYPINYTTVRLTAKEVYPLIAFPKDKHFVHFQQFKEPEYREV